MCRVSLNLYWEWFLQNNVEQYSIHVIPVASFATIFYAQDLKMEAEVILHFMMVDAFCSKLVAQVSHTKTNNLLFFGHLCGGIQAKSKNFGIVMRIEWKEK